MNQSLIGLPVQNPAGKPLGYAKELYVNKSLSRTTCLVCVNDEEELFFVPAHAVKAEKDRIIAAQARLRAPLGIPYPVGKPLFDRKGNFLGTIAALETDGRGAVIVRGGKLPLVLPVGSISVEDVAVLRGKNESNSCKRMPKNVTCAEPRQIEADPTDRAGGSDLPRGLLGRRVAKSLASQTETVAVAGEIVTADTLQRARRNNLLLALAADTLTD